MAKTINVEEGTPTVKHSQVTTPDLKAGEHKPLTTPPVSPISGTVPVLSPRSSPLPKDSEFDTQHVNDGDKTLDSSDVGDVDSDTTSRATAPGEATVAGPPQPSNRRPTQQEMAAVEENFDMGRWGIVDVDLFLDTAITKVSRLTIGPGGAPSYVYNAR